MPASGAQPARPCLRRRVLLSVSCLILAGLSAVAVRSLIDRPLSEAADGLAGMAPEYVLLAAAMFALAPLFCGLAWHQAILLAGGRLGRVDACTRYGVGSLVNSVAPAHLGDVVRAVLLLERLPPGSRGGILPWFGVIQGARLAALAALTIAALLPGPLALLALAAPAGALLVTARRSARLALFAFLAPFAKAAAIAVVLQGLGVGSPRDALVVVPALELAALLPLTPGNIGVAGAAAAGALHAQGLPISEAVQAGLVLHAIETAAGLVYGTGATLVWTGGLGTNRGLVRGPRALQQRIVRAVASGRVQAAGSKP